MCYHRERLALMVRHKSVDENAHGRCAGNSLNLSFEFSLKRMGTLALSTICFFFLQFCAFVSSMPLLCLREMRNSKVNIVKKNWCGEWVPLSIGRQLPIGVRRMNLNSIKAFAAYCRNPMHIFDSIKLRIGSHSGNAGGKINGLSILFHK